MAFSSEVQQIVQYNGQFIAMGCYTRVYSLQLTPKLGLTIEQQDKLTPSVPWAAMCGQHASHDHALQCL
jgi:hypothetical protein